MVHASGLLDALVALFERMWAQASPLLLGADGAPELGSPLSGPDRRLLSLMLAGRTDEAIAHHLAVSRRTVQRHISELQERAGAKNRLDLVWLAAKPDWL